MNLFQAIALSIVEGITEFLPISSTGHMILVGSLIGVKQSAFTSSFEIFIQLGAILAILVLYSGAVIKNKQTLIRLSFAFLPTAVVGLVLYKFIKAYLLTNPWIVVWSLLIGGFVLIGLEFLLRRTPKTYTTIESIPIKSAVAIGLAQSISVIPGISRAAATIIGGQLNGLSRQAAVEFSFLLALPTMLAATGLDLLKSDIRTFTAYEFGLMGMGSLVSFITALIVVKLFLKYIQHHSFISFGIYRICIAIIYTIVIL